MIIATHGIVASQILTVPVATAATSVGDSSFTANWNAYTGASYYLLDVSLNSSFSSYVLQDQVTTSTSYAVTGLSSNTTYYYRVRANVGTDPDAQAFFDRVTTAGGSLSATEQTAINTLVIQMKADGIWTKMKAIYPMVGASAAACAQNLKSSSFTGTFTATGWTFASTGVTPNGTSAYMNTNLSPSGNLSQTSQAFSLYIRDNPSSTGWDLNSEDSGATIFSLIIASYGGGAAFVGNNTGLTSASTTTALGFTLNTRINNSGYKIFRNNASVLTVSTATGGQTTTNFILGARNTSASFANKNYAFAHIGDGLTDTEASNLYTSVQAFQTTLSRNV